MKRILLLLVYLYAIPGKAQKADSLAESRVLEAITVTASKLPDNVNLLPLSITQIDSTLIQYSKQNLSIKEYLQMVPGLYVQNANNFAQDARISIRGFGATAAFGIRGIKLIVDGIPETTPDGTGQLDNLNLNLIDGIQVIRGSASSLYGNASGGAILVQSKFDFDQNYLESSSAIGSYGFYSQAFSGGVKSDSTIITGHVRLFGSDGFRENSSFRQVNARVAAKHKFSDRLTATIISEYVNSPEARDAGGLTLEETEVDFTAARDRNLTFDAGEEITQWKVGSNLEWQWSANKTLNTYVFFNQRTFDGRLPFENSGQINLERNYFGFGNSLDLYSGSHEIKAGYDFLSQTDDRHRFDNVEGQQGNQRLDQEESFVNFGWYLLDYFSYSRWNFSVGLRQDFNRLRAVDRFLEDGDDSGEIDLVNWNYNVGVGFMITPSLQAYANHSTNFETPTLNQLSNRPDNSGGFEDLDAATASSFELGLKWNRRSFNVELTGFMVNTENELVPYELAEFPERTFFRNAGNTNRQGIEMAASYTSEKWQVFSSYTFSDFVYEDYIANEENFDGLDLPGIPKHRGAVTVVARPLDNLELSAPIDLVGTLWADDSNETEVEGYVELGLTMSYLIELPKLTIKPSFGIRNLTDQQYFDNIRINAFGNRHYEPAPGRNYYAGLIISL